MCPLHTEHVTRVYDARQVLTRQLRLTLKGCDRLLCVLSTCTGDDFAVWTAEYGGLRLVYDLLCRMDADPSLVRDATAAGGKGGFALYHSLQQTFMQTLERARLTYGRSHGGRPPSGGCWDVIGYKEVLRMEERITGKSWSRGQRTTAAAKPAAVKKNAPAARAAAAKAEPAATAATKAAEKAARAAAAKDPVLKPLPWDPQAARVATGSAASSRSGGGGGGEAAIKTGFFGPRRRTRAAAAEAERAAKQAAMVRAAAEAAAARQEAEAAATGESAAEAMTAAMAAMAAGDDEATDPDGDAYDEDFEEEYARWKQSQKVC
jgi:hypothetical protein